jgi:uncharacterized protein YgbK (DUF1537 family)
VTLPPGMSVDAGALQAGRLQPWSEPVVPAIRTLAGGRPQVVLDDDPTGTQTVRAVTVVARVDGGDLEAALETRPETLFVLTNSRSLAPLAAARLARELGRRLRAWSDRTGLPASITSRSDSTLRGHFPVEVDALAEGLGWPDAVTLLAPYFGPGGRLTVDDVHYLVRDDRAYPVADTEYARDPTFGYRHSNLLDWVRERTGADRPVAAITLETIRGGGPDAVAARLLDAPPRACLVVNAADERDIEVVAAGVLPAEREGRQVIARTAASYVRARAGQPLHPLLGPADLPIRSGPGLVVVGSHVPATTRQLERLLDEPPLPIEPLEIDAGRASSEGQAAAAVAEVLSRVRRAMAGGRTPVVHTSRTLVSGMDPLQAASRVSAALTEVVRGLADPPAWVLAKGGITSSDVATAGLGVRTATVLGQLRPGVPVWRSDATGRWPGLVLVVFPGNVGSDDDLRMAVAALAVAAGPIAAAQPASER